MRHDFTELFAGADRRDLLSGAFLFHAGDTVRFVCLVENGAVSLERVQAGGRAICFQRAGIGDVLAEASVYAQKYHCDARALEETRLLRLNKADFLSRLSRDQGQAHAWASHLARAVQHARLNAEIRSFKTISERLDAWLDVFGHLPRRGQWQSLAEELSVSREALYRELAKRRSSEGQS